jgi:lipoprotein-anchoring transpeptidase ErfK/SrfK
MRRSRALSLAAATVAVAAAPGDAGGGAGGTSRFQPLEVRPAAEVPPGAGFITAWLERGVRVRNRPRGRVVGRLQPRTTWGTPTIVSVVEMRGSWLGVSTELRPNGRLGWIPASATRLTRVREKIVADLSRRTVTLFRAGRALRTIRVAIGRPANPTPTGRFAITDLLLVKEASPYGCCVIALSGRQPRIPAGWPGGNRLAIHATNDPSSIGRAASIGCLRARASDMRWLIRQALQPGTPVFIRR